MNTLTLDSLAKLADYTSEDGHIIRPGCYFVARGGGDAGAAIRLFTGSWAGHAGIYVGNGRIVESVPPAALNSAADSRPDARFNYREGRDLSPEQRLKIVNKAHDLVGTPYDYLAYLGFVMEAFEVMTVEGRDRWFNRKHQVCSALVADCYWAAGVDLDPSSKIGNLVSPADLYDRIARY